MVHLSYKGTHTADNDEHWTQISEQQQTEVARVLSRSCSKKFLRLFISRMGSFKTVFDTQPAASRSKLSRMSRSFTETADAVFMSPRSLTKMAARNANSNYPLWTFAEIGGNELKSLFYVFRSALIKISYFHFSFKATAWLEFCCYNWLVSL